MFILDVFTGFRVAFIVHRRTQPNVLKLSYSRSLCVIVITVQYRNIISQWAFSPKKLHSVHSFGWLGYFEWFYFRWRMCSGCNKLFGLRCLLLTSAEAFLCSFSIFPRNRIKFGGYKRLAKIKAQR